MARIDPIGTNNLSPSVKVAFERHLEQYNGKITNTKATLGHSLLAFEIYMQWYPLYESVEKILGNRLACLFGYAISSASSCKVCSAFFRKKIIESGSNPDELELTMPQRDVMNFGKSITLHNGNIADHVYNEVARLYSPSELVVLIAFAGQMLATNVFNNIIETEPDDYLKEYLPAAKYC